MTVCAGACTFKLLKTVILFLLSLCMVQNTLAQKQGAAMRDSLRKVFYGKYSYTHSYGFETIHNADGTSMEVIPFSDEVTYYELELYRYGSFVRDVRSNKPESMLNYFHHVDFGNWRIDGDTLFLKVTEMQYDYYFIIGNHRTYYPTYTPVEEPYEEKYYLISGAYFCSSLSPSSSYYDRRICYSRRG